jgi:isopenicillin N synthase-like dioxygenase
MQQVAATLGRALARLLDVPEREWFAVMGGNWADLAANFYPPLRADEDHGEVVYNAPHRDLTVFTILHQDQNRTGGLSVIGSDGSVIDVEPVPGTFAVNAGELLTYLSSGRWVAAMHQVTVSEVTESEARISVPFFYRPSDERVVTSFVDSQAKPIAMRQWVLDRKRGVDATVS